MKKLYICKLVLFAAFLLTCFVFYSCTDLDDTTAPLWCDITDVRVSVMDNQGILPMPVKNNSVRKEKLTLNIELDANYAIYNRKLPLNDPIKAIRILAKVSTKDAQLAREVDISNHFELVNNGGLISLTDFSMYFYTSTIQIVSLLDSETDIDIHELSIELELGSGAIIKRTTETIELI